MQKVLWEAAKQDEIRQFQDLWMEKVSEMLMKQTDISQWIKIETRKDGKNERGKNYRSTGP